MTWWYKIKEYIVVSRYVHYGLIVGNMDSYSFMGDSVDSGWWYAPIFSFWERQYINLGYAPLSNHQWQLSGGYGAPYKHLLKRKEIDT